MANLVDFGGRLEPGDLVVVTSEAFATDAYNDLLGVVDTKEEGGKCNVLFTMVDGTTSLMKIVTKNLIKIYDCEKCGALDVEWRCSRCHVAGGCTHRRHTQYSQR